MYSQAGRFSSKTLVLAHCFASRMYETNIP